MSVFSVVKNWKSISVVLLLAMAAGVWFYSKRTPEILWRTGTLELGTLKVTVTATGTLRAVQTVQVGTQVSGTISALYVDFNSQVKKGQVIARIDTTLLKASLTDAYSLLEKSTAQAQQAKDERKRTQILFDRSLVSQAELDQATANDRIASANQNSAKAQVERARINLKYATIISPIDGVILSRAVDVGQTVAATFNTPTLFTLAGDLKQMQVIASVDEADIGKIKVGQKATFTVDAFPELNFLGEVFQIRLLPVTVQNVVSYDVVFSVPNPDLKLMPGMTASLNIVVQAKENVLMIPTTALRFTPPDWKKAKIKSESKEDKKKSKEKSFELPKFFILENGKPKPVSVKIGLTNGTQTVVESSLPPGTEILTGIQSSSPAGKTSAAPFGMQRSPGGGGGRGYH